MNNPRQINEDNLSIAWLKALKAALTNDKNPLCVSIFGLENGIQEDAQIRNELDALLAGQNEISVKETSETLFPYGHWRSRQPSSLELASWYTERYLPRHKARVRKVRSSTPKETYFERLVAYPGFRKSQQGIEPININQLERIISIFKHYSAKGKNPSPSKFIATCLNPSIDNTGLDPYLPFPCLQQVGFSFVNGSITVTGFYTIQYLMKRGYGNYLGLCHLGQFMSKETGLPLSRVNCFVGNPRIDKFKKTALTPILSHLSS